MEAPQQYKSSRIWKKAINVSFTEFLLFYTLGVFNPSQLNVAATLKWGSNTETFINLFSTLLTVGQFIGCIMTGILIDQYGRRKTMILMDSLFLTGSIILVMPSTICFGIGRFITGIAIGICPILGPVYLNESTPQEIMPKVAPLIYAFGGIGMIISYALGLILPVDNMDTDPKSYLWILMFLFPALIATYQLIYFSFFVKFDTALFYLSKSNSVDAEKALDETHHEVSFSIGLRRVKSEIEGKSHNGINLSFFGMLKIKKFRKMMRFGIMFAAIQELSSVTGIFFYSTDIFYRLGGGLFLARIFTMIIGVVYCFSTLSGVWLLKIFSRKVVFIASQFFIFVILLLIAFFTGYIEDNQVAAASMLIIFFIPFGCGIISSGWMYATEVLNDQIFSYASTLCFGFSTIVSFLFPTSIEFIGISTTFLIFSISMGICSIYSVFDFIETKDKDKETILIEMGVIDRRVIPIADENGNLQSPHDYENENSFIRVEKVVFLNGKEFNDDSINIKGDEG